MSNKPTLDIKEELAAIEHERWADWQRYVHSRMKKQGEEGMLMSVSDYLHWEEQIAADYSELTEAEKNSDREQVDRYWPLIEQLIADIIGENYEAKDPFNEGRNKLRAEQRQRAKERGIDL